MAHFPNAFTQSLSYNLQRRDVTGGHNSNTINSALGDGGISLFPAILELTIMYLYPSTH
jgi:hypothetical protein